MPNLHNYNNLIFCSLRSAPALLGFLLLGGCGNYGVNYAGVSSAPDKIVADASQGYLNVALPVTRVLIQVEAPSGTQNGGDDKQGPTAAPPDMPVAPDATKAKAGGAGTKPAKPAKPAKPVAGTSKSNTGGNDAGSGNGSSGSDLTTTVTLNDGTKISLTLVQAEGPTRFRVNALNDFFSKNQFTIQKLANTDIPTSVGNQFTDLTVSRIQSVVEIAGTLAKVALPLVPGTTVAPPPDATESPVCASSGNYSAIDLNNSYQWHGYVRGAKSECYEIDIGTDKEPAHEDNTVSISYFKAAVPAEPGQTATAPANWSEKVWPVPACLDVPYSVTQLDAATGAVLAGGYQASGMLRVIDPSNVLVLPLPQSGKISMHPICNADFSDSPVDKYQADFDVMNAVMKAIPSKTAKASTDKQTKSN